MTKPMMDLKELVEKSADADLLREMIGFAAERLMELEVGAKTGADYIGRRRSGRRRETATANAIGRREPGTWNCGFRSCAPAAIFLLSWSRGGRQRRR